MIRINKGAAPQSLIETSLVLNNVNIALYNSNKRAFKNGSMTFTFTNAYKSDDVKETLYTIQHGKCFCTEALFVRDQFHVEHFRPKGRVDEYPNGTKGYPGYYWLAYEWSNLWLCKSVTNTSDKKCYFPTTGRRKLHHSDPYLEIPTLIDPSIDDPREHIRFKNEEIYGITDRGKTTIEILKLRASDLDEARRQKFELLKNLKEAVDLLIEMGFNVNSPQLVPMINVLKDAITPKAEFSSMAIDLLQDWPHIQ